MNIKMVGVVGAGSMGHGIAISAAMAGFDTVLVDSNENALENGMEKAAFYLDGLVEKELIKPDQKGTVLKRIKPIGDLNGLGNADLVIEAVYENEELKKELIKNISKVAKNGAIIASNTSSVSITRLASVAGAVENFIGIHFMNPVPRMELVEIIRGAKTSEATYNTALSFCTALGKTAITSKDYPGFIVNRLLMPMINEAVFALEEGVASAEDIDNAMTLGLNHPMGPLRLADFIGLDICLNILEVMQKGTGDPKFRASQLLKMKVDAGELGRKTGQGFFNWEQG